MNAMQLAVANLLRPPVTPDTRRKCAVCGAKFVVDPRSPASKMCSEPCRDIHHNAVKRAKAKAAKARWSKDAS